MRKRTSIRRERSRFSIEFYRLSISFHQVLTLRIGKTATFGTWKIALLYKNRHGLMPRMPFFVTFVSKSVHFPLKDSHYQKNKCENVSGTPLFLQLPPQRPPDPPPEFLPNNVLFSWSTPPPYFLTSKAGKQLLFDLGASFWPIKVLFRRYGHKSSYFLIKWSIFPIPSSYNSYSIDKSISYLLSPISLILFNTFTL